MRKKLGIIILVAFLAMGISACNISGGGSALEKAVYNQNSQSQKSENSTDSTDNKLSEIAEKHEKNDNVDSKTESEYSKTETSETKNSDNKSLNTEFAKFISAFKDNYESGKKIIMKSDVIYESIGAAEVSIFKIDGKECIITDISSTANLDSSLDEITKSLTANKQIMISDGKYTYLVTGNKYQKFESEGPITSTFTDMSEAFENVELIKVEDGYEYFKIKEDIINGEATIADGEKVLIDDDESSEAEDSILVTKVKDGVCYVYRNTPDVLYMTLEYSDVTDEDKKAVDLSQYEESETGIFTIEDEEANND